MLRLIIGGFIGLTVMYWIVLTYARSIRREKLETAFDAGGKDGRREDFIATGMAQYEQGLQRRLIVLVYVIPVVLIVVIAYVVNHT